MTDISTNPKTDSIASNTVLFSVADILAWTGGILHQGSRDLGITGMSNDSRVLRPGYLFVALVAERDGHTFIDNALQAGASALLVCQAVQNVPADVAVIQVQDTLQGMGDISAGYRQTFPACKVVGVTGSNGKTTTKEMISSILREEGPTLSTAGNFNNLIGLPLTLLGLRQDHTYAVLEMGMNVPGEIARLAEIAQPNVGVITCVASAHLEGLGSIEGVAQAKGELFAALGPQQWAVVNADDPHVRKLADTLACPAVFFSMTPEQARIPIGQPAVTLQRLEPRGTDGFRFEVRAVHLPGLIDQTGTSASFWIDLPLVGRHQVANALAAISVALVLGASKQAIVSGLQKVRPTGRRLLLEQTSLGVHLLDDCYNSNPHSCRAALQTLAELAGSAPSVAVIGDMLELGSHELQAHAEVGAWAAKQRITHLVTFGPRSVHAAQVAQKAGLASVASFQDIDHLWTYLQPLLQPGVWVLVKGSRGMKLERISEKIKQP